MPNLEACLELKLSNYPVTSMIILDCVVIIIPFDESFEVLNQRFPQVQCGQPSERPDLLRCVHVRLRATTEPSSFALFTRVSCKMCRQMA